MARGSDPRIELRVRKGAIVRRDGRSLRASDVFSAPAREAWDLIREGFASPASGAADEAFDCWFDAQPTDVRDLPFAPSAPSARVVFEVVTERERRDVGDDAFAAEVVLQRRHMPSLPPKLLGV